MAVVLLPLQVVVELAVPAQCLLVLMVKRRIVRPMVGHRVQAQVPAPALPALPALPAVVVVVHQAMKYALVVSNVVPVSVIAMGHCAVRDIVIHRAIAIRNISPVAIQGIRKLVLAVVALQVSVNV